MLKTDKFRGLRLVRPTAKPVDYEAIENEVAAIYKEIFRLDTPQKQSRALNSWYEYLKKTCTSDEPCIECLRERRR